MKTRFTSLVKLKKSSMQKSEQAMQQANTNLNSATLALKASYNSLNDIATPQSGKIGDILASRVLFGSQREIISHNKNWLEFAKNQTHEAKERLKLDMIEYEKFNYLELQEIKQELARRKIAEAKDLDEVALMTYKRGNR